MTRYTGHEAIDLAAARGIALNKHADPIEGAREGISVEEARTIAREDPSLVWVDVETNTYSVDCIDSEEPADWQRTRGLVTMTPGARDSGRCRWTVTTTDPDALVAALEADDSVIEYEEVTMHDGEE